MLEALILFFLLMLLWATVLTYRSRRLKVKNGILENRVRYYIELINKLKLNPTSDGKEDREKESEEA